MTHKQRVLELLRDGKAHTHHELYALNVIAHSRIADLRRDGHTIECWRDGDDSMYRLVRDVGGGSDRGTDASSSSVSSLDRLGADGNHSEFAGRHGAQRDAATGVECASETPLRELTPLKPGFASKDDATEDGRDGPCVVTGAKSGLPEQLAFLDAPKRGAYHEAAA
jgi:hypothetical protein